MENYALYIHLVGLAILAIALISLAFRAFRNWRKGLFPLALAFLGIAITLFPPLYHLAMPIDLGPRERVVEGRRVITLTGWDRKDYAFLGSKQDVAVLQMANRDVTDKTLDQLAGMERLEDLDLSNTQITDAGLKSLENLKALSTLRLKNTKITDQGFQKSLAGKESLTRLDLSGTQVSRETVGAWLKAKTGRKAMQ